MDCRGRFAASQWREGAWGKVFLDPPETKVFCCFFF
jgi:hypothetical protein